MEDFIHLKGASASESAGQQTPEKKKVRTRTHQIEQATGVALFHSTLDVDSEMEGGEKVQMVEQEQPGSFNTNSPPNLVNTTISEHSIKEDSGEESKEEQSYLSQPISKKLRKAKGTPRKEQLPKKAQPLPNKPQVP
jgi:hypothetical protein